MVNRAFASGLVVLCAAGTQLLLAQSTKFAAEKSRLHQEAVKARAAKGVDLLDPVLEKQYPYPVMTAPRVQKLLPGASAMVTVAGKFYSTR